MRYIFLAILLTTASCRPQSEKMPSGKDVLLQEETDKKNTTMDKTEIFYAVSLQIDVPFELYLDDIPIAKEYSMSRKIMGVDLNPYLLSNGSHKVKARFLPPTDGMGTLVAKNHLRTSFLKLVSYEKQTEPGMGRVNNYKILEELPLDIPQADLPLLELEWAVEITDLPYEIQGWRDSQNLNEMDSDELEKEVFKFYEKLRTALNRGTPEEYFDLAEQRTQETRVFGYLTEQEITKDIKSNIRRYEEEAKGNMWPIENYQVFIYGYGKLVKLERTDGENRGWNGLIRKTENGSITSIGTLLHKPQGKENFEIIRK